MIRIEGARSSTPPASQACRANNQHIHALFCKHRQCTVPLGGESLLRFAISRARQQLPSLCWTLYNDQYPPYSEWSFAFWSNTLLQRRELKVPMNGLQSLASSPTLLFQSEFRCPRDSRLCNYGRERGLTVANRVSREWFHRYSTRQPLDLLGFSCGSMGILGSPHHYGKLRVVY